MFPRWPARTPAFRWTAQGGMERWREDTSPSAALARAGTCSFERWDDNAAGLIFRGRTQVFGIDQPELSILLEPVVQCPTADAQLRCRGGAIAVVPLDGGEDFTTLKVPE